MRSLLALGILLLALVAATSAQAQLTGSGTVGRVPKWTGATTLGDSVITENGGRVGIAAPAPTSCRLQVRDGDGLVQVRSSLSTLVSGSNNGGAIYFGVDNANNKNAPTAAIETSWGGGLLPQIAIGVTRDFASGHTANLLLDYLGNTNIRQGTTTHLLVRNGGNVGVGTIDPGAKLHVKGQLAVHGIGLSGSLLQRFQLYTDTTNGVLFEAPLIGDSMKMDYHFNWRGGGPDALTIKGNGRVGIGTDKPTAKLDVTATSADIVSISGTSFANGGTGVGGEARGAGFARGVVGFAFSPDGMGGDFRNTAGVGLQAIGGGDGRHKASLRVSNISSTRGMAAYLTNGSEFATAHFANSRSGQVLYLQNGGDDAGKNGGDFIQAVNRTEGTSQFRVLSSGEVRSNVGFATPAADFAEMMPAEAAAEEEPLESGDVLIVGPHGLLMRSTRPEDRAVVGIYSARPGFVGGHGVDRRDPAQIAVAILGIVPVKVTTENGTIRPGDLLVSSSVPGHAMKAGSDPEVGTVLGKALGAMEATTGKIKMLVLLQ